MHMITQSRARTGSTVKGGCIHKHTNHTLVTLTLNSLSDMDPPSPGSARFWWPLNTTG